MVHGIWDVCPCSQLCWSRKQATAAAGLTRRLFAAIWLQFRQVLRVNTSRCALQAAQIHASRTMVSGDSLASISLRKIGAPSSVKKRFFLCVLNECCGLVMLMLSLITCEANCASGQALCLMSRPTKDTACSIRNVAYESAKAYATHPYNASRQTSMALRRRCRNCRRLARQLCRRSSATSFTPSELQWQDACRPRLPLAARLHRLLLSSCATTSRNTSGVRSSSIPNS